MECLPPLPLQLLPLLLTATLAPPELPALPLLLELCMHADGAVGAVAAACLAGVVQLHPEDAAAILAAEGTSLPTLLATVLQSEEGEANEAAAYHLLHAIALAARQPAFQRRQEATEELALAARRALHSGSSNELRQAAAEALSALGQLQLVR